MSSYRRSRMPGATFFFTLAMADRSTSTLVDHIGLLRAVYRSVVRKRPLETIAICVLPDHVHAVWQLPPNDHDFSTRWSSIKSGFSRQFPAVAARSRSKRTRREKGIWQRRFWEHEIRGAGDLERHVDYIHYNPVRHGLVTEVAAWPYSSFHRYVREGLLAPDWGGSEIVGDYGEPPVGKRPTGPDDRTLTVDVDVCPPYADV